jgi:sensor histidine kinase YesM
MLKWLKKHLVFIVILVLIGNLTAFFIDPGFVRYPKMWLSNSFFAIVLGFPMMKLNEYVAKRIGNKIGWEKHPVKRIVLTLTTIIVLATIITLLINYFYVVYLNRLSFREFLASTFNMLFIEILIIVYVFTIFTGVGFFNMWREGLAKQESLLRKSIELQLESLKDQVNPHFLFNSLNTLASLVPKNQEQAVKFIIGLSDIYRYVLEQKNMRTVEWEVERQFVENYLSLQEIRFAGNIRAEIESTGNNHFLVVPLSVQTLVENAIKHNVITTDDPLQISIFREADCLVVKNNLQPKTTIGNSGKVGLENVRQQYEILTGRKVEVMKNDGYFTVKLPIIEKPENET